MPLSSAGFARAILLLGGGREEHAVRHATTVGRGAKPPSESQTPSFSRVTALSRSSRDDASKTMSPFSMM